MPWIGLFVGSWIIIPSLLGEPSRDGIVYKTIIKCSFDAMLVRIPDGFIAHDGYINPCLLGKFYCFLKLISVILDDKHGLETFWSVLKLSKLFYDSWGAF